MDFFRKLFCMSLHRRLRSPGALVVLLLCAGLTLGIFLPPAEGTLTVQVGLVLPESGARELEELLLERAMPPIAFVPTDEETLDRMLLSGRWDCGLVVPEDFSRRLAEMDTEELLTLKTGPGSTVYPLVRETAAACLMELLTPGIAMEYMEDIGLDAAALPARLEAIRENTTRVEVRMQTLDGQPLPLPELMEGTGRQILRNLGAVLLLIWGICLGMSLGRWLQSPTALRLRSLRGVTALVLPQLFAGLLLPALWALAVLPALKGGLSTALCLPGFLLTAAGLGLLIARFPGLWRGVPVLLPFLVLGMLVLEPVLVDVRLVFPGLSRFTCWLPVTLFCRSDPAGALLLLLEGAGLLALSFRLDGKGMFSRGK